MEYNFGKTVVKKKKSDVVRLIFHIRLEYVRREKKKTYPWIGSIRRISRNWIWREIRGV
jgi:hypothetical protein